MPREPGASGASGASGGASEDKQTGTAARRASSASSSPSRPRPNLGGISGGSGSGSGPLSAQHAQHQQPQPAQHQQQQASQQPHGLPSPWVHDRSKETQNPVMLVEVKPKTEGQEGHPQHHQSGSGGADGSPVRKRPKPLLPVSGPDFRELQPAEAELLNERCKQLEAPLSSVRATARFLTLLRVTRSPPWLPGGYDAWVAAALFVVEQDITPDHLVQSRNRITLSQILDTCDVNFHDFNVALNAVVETCNTQRGLPPIGPVFRGRIAAVKWAFTITAALREKAVEAFDMFVSRKYRDGDVENRAMKMVWVSFLIAKHICLSPAAQRQLVVLYALVVCSVHHLLRVLAPLERLVTAPHARAVRKDESVWGEESLLYIASILNIDHDTIKTVHAAYWRFFLQRYGQHMAFTPTRGLPTREALASLDGVYDALYRFPLHCHIDERLFITRHKQVVGGPSGPSPAPFRIPQSFVEATRSPRVRLTNPSPSPAHHQHRQQHDNDDDDDDDNDDDDDGDDGGGAASKYAPTPQARTLAQLMLNRAGPRPPLELASLLLQTGHLGHVTAAVTKAEERFRAAASACRLIPSAQIAPHWDVACRVLYVLLDAAVAVEKEDEAKRGVVTVLCTHDDNMQAMVALASQVASVITHLSPTHTPEGDIEWVLSTFEASPVTYWKVTERAVRDVLCEYPIVASPLAKCERHILSCLIWRKQNVWPAFRSGLPAVAFLRHAHDEAWKEYRLRQERKKRGREQAGRRDDDDARCSDDEEEEEDVPGLPPTFVRKRLTTYYLAIKFYDAAAKRLAQLADSHTQIDQQMQRKIWTTFEYAATTHTHLFYERHVDAILLCCVAVTLKTHRANATTLKREVESYHAVLGRSALTNEIVERVPVSEWETQQLKQMRAEQERVKVEAVVKEEEESAAAAVSPGRRATWGGGVGGGAQSHRTKPCRLNFPPTDQENKLHPVRIYDLYQDVFLPCMQAFALRWTTDDEPPTASYPITGPAIAATPRVPTRHGTVRIQRSAAQSPAMQRATAPRPQPTTATTSTTTTTTTAALP